MGITCHSELVATCLTTMHQNAASNFIMCRCELITSMPRAVRLSWLENAYSCSSFWRVILTRKVGQTDLVSGVWSGFTSWSVHETLQFSVCTGYNLCHIG